MSAPHSFPYPLAERVHVLPLSRLADPGFDPLTVI
jgi:hypothetical protein